MNTHTTVPPAARSGRQGPSNLFKSLIASKITQQKPVPFASTLAHEVRNPLTNINLAVEMLRSTIRDAERRNYLDIIIRGSGRINDLVSDLLAICQSNDLLPGSHCIHKLIDEVLVMSEDRLLLKNIEVRKDYTTMDCTVLVEKEKMKMALTNIIINAIDAMPSENGKLKLITRSINGQCVIEIEDNGIGISEENLTHIFEPYFTDKPGGMGLGLSTTRETLLANHATIEVRSEKGKGTRFMLTFDRVQRPEETPMNRLF